MKLKLILFFSVFIGFVGYSQNTWVKVAEGDGYIIESKKEACHDDFNGIHQEFVLLRVRNLGDKPATISYDLELYFNGKCYTCNNNDNELHKKVYVDAGSEVVGSCDNTNDNSLRIFSKFLDMNISSKLSKFQITNINYSQAQ